MMKRIIVDMMGGDLAPAETVKGVELAKNELGPDIEYILVGNKKEIEQVAEENCIDLEPFRIVDTEVVITMEDDPRAVVRAKSDSSMSIGLRMLKEGEGDAFVSTGNTGALFTGANLIVRKLKGVRRPAIAALVPLQTPILLVDSGANVIATPQYLEQFAIMGSAYMKSVMGVDEPRVGLLNNGVEEHKGTELQIETYKLLGANKDINFVGNVEANSAVAGGCDVLVTDGYTGNIFLKAIEGLGKMMLKTLKGVFYKNAKTRMSALLVKEEIGGMKKTFDASEMGGAPILGIAKPVIKAHGSSDAKAFKNAIRQAIAFADANIGDEIEAALEKLSEDKKQKESASEGKENAEN